MNNKQTERVAPETKKCGVGSYWNVLLLDCTGDHVIGGVFAYVGSRVLCGVRPGVDVGGMGSHIPLQRSCLQHRIS